MKNTMKKILCIVLIVVMCLVSAPLQGFLELGFRAEADEYKTGDIILFGSYPQSEVKDADIISKLNELAPEWDNWISYGYYSGNESVGSMKQGDWMRYTDVTYNGNKYRGVKFTQYRPYWTVNASKSEKSHQDENGYETDVAYWFLFEDIKWRVLDPSSGLVLSEIIIDSQAFNNTSYQKGNGTYDFFNNTLYENYANDYESSSIREWLNDDFYNIAFNENEKNAIITAELNNSGYYTSIGDSGYEKLDSKDTNDKIFLLSYNEARNEKFGFNASNTSYDKLRVAYGSDYAKSQGLGVAQNGFVTWHLRSPGFHSNYCSLVHENGLSYGYNFFYYVYDADLGVRPAFYLNENAISSNITSTMKIKGNSGATNSVSKGEEVTFYVYLLKNGEYVPCKNNYAFSFDNPGVFEAVSVGRNNDCFAVKLKAQNIGSTNMTISDDESGAKITIQLRSNMPLNAATFDDVKEQGTFYEHGSYHYWNYYYDYNGLYVNNFSYLKRDNNYYVNMNVFNEKAHYGAVVSYDKEGNVADYELINQMDKLPTSLWDGLFDSFDLTNAWLGKGLPGEYLFVNGTIAKETPIRDLKVPEGGYLVISNNCVANEFVFLANVLDITIDCSLAISKIPCSETNEAAKNVIEDILNNFLPDALGKLSTDVITNLIKELSFNNIGDVLVELSKEFEKADIDLWKILKDSINAEFGFSLAEGIAFQMLGLDFIADIFGYTNTMIKMFDINCSQKAPQIAIYAPGQATNSRTSNGITVMSTSPMNNSYVLHTYLLSDSSSKKSQAKKTIESISKNYEMYDISLYKNGETAQPETEIEIFIPIPAGMNKNRIQVYWYKDDGTIKSMKAEVRGDYAVFKTDHLSYYIICDVFCTDHKYVEDVTEPTCEEQGYTTYTCICGDTYTETIEATGHDGVVMNKTEATASENGYTGDIICSVCGELLEEGEIIPATGEEVNDCSHMCHKSGILGIFWKIICFIQKLFGMNPVCECGAAHY